MQFVMWAHACVRSYGPYKYSTARPGHAHARACVCRQFTAQPNDAVICLNVNPSNRGRCFLM